MPRIANLSVTLAFACLGAPACSSGANEDAGPAPTETAVAVRNDCETVFGSDRLSGALNSFGECTGACVSELRFDSTSGCRSLTLDIRGWGAAGRDAGSLFPLNHGALTDKGVVLGQEVAASLRGKNLLGTYGCPDCADGGATVLYKQSGPIESAVVYEFEHPPVELRTADSFLQPLIDALETCVDSDLIAIDSASCTTHR
jgi:hypothetical protein